VLPGISTEQLRSRLNRMVADGMLTRKRYREVPPRVDYELTERARELLPVLGELARWGYEWAWSSPRNTEHVDLGAIFRLAPGLVDATGLRGVVEFTVTGGKQDGESATYALSASSGRLAIEEAPAERADAHVRGDTAAWVQAFSPEGERSRLEITGDRRLAERMLDGLGPHEVRAERAANAA
jgi:HxlR-like helix-turn-helix/SCP-2 sterol transfer family